MNVLSLFDGMSCGQIALDRLNIKVDNYFACEIDKHSMSVTQDNYPDTIQLGSVTDLDTSNLPQIDLLIGGSPCQGFSFAGKQLNFNDDRSKLFFEYVRILKETKPKYFLLENVKMKKQYQDVITQYLGVEPIEINSMLLSAQHRRRLYWTNIPNIEQPEDKGILLEDILEKGITGEKVEYDKNGECLLLARNKKNIRLTNNIAIPHSIYETRTEEGKKERKRLRELLGRDTTPRGKKYKEYASLKTKKANCLVATPSELDSVVDLDMNYRKLTITECERLQTVDDDYTKKASLSQRRKMLGNGWTVDVIKYIFKSMYLNERIESV